MKAIPYGRQSITDEEIQEVIKTLKSDFLTQGPKIKEFEDQFAEYVNAEYAVAVSNATAGLHLSVLALGLKDGDRVITTPISFAATANCARYVGAEVWFADIDRETYTLSLESTRKLIESKPEGFFSGIIPVDLAGLPINSEAFRSLANEHNLWIIEDACHAPGGYYIDSKKAKITCGSSVYADLSVFSFHPVKHIACGEGGMITTNNKDLAEKLETLRTHGITKNNMSENHGGWFYEMQDLGFNYRLTDIQATLGISQLRKNVKGVKIRNKIADKYKSSLEGKFKFQALPEGMYNAHHLFIIESENRLDLYNYLRSNQIYCQIHYIPIHTLPYYKDIGYQDADLKNAEDYYSKCISLPMFPTLTKDEQNYIIETILKYEK